MKLDDEYIIKYINKHKAIRYFNNDVFDYLKQRYDDSSSIDEIIYRLKNHIDEYPICPICGKKLKFYDRRHGFAKTCSKECGAKLSQLTRESNNLKKFGVKNVFQIDEYKRKSRETCKRKYGVEYGFQNEDIKHKYRKTCLIKYGVDNTSKLEQTKQKISNTIYKHYGVKSGFQLISKEKRYKILEKSRKTCLERYNVENPFSADKFKQKIMNTNLQKYGFPNPSKNVEIKNKIRQTCLIKYGVDCFFKSKKYKDSINWNIIKEKTYQTKKRNHSFKQSKTEDQAYELLMSKYPDVIRQYKSIEYPFNCDFYIPSLNLYIECQFGQFHHNRPYLGTKKDLEDIEILKQKSNIIKQNTKRQRTRYDAEIETWTIRDVKKRMWVKTNNLNFIEVWDISELKNILNSNENIESILNRSK